MIIFNLVKKMLQNEIHNAGARRLIKIEKNKIWISGEQRSKQNQVVIKSFYDLFFKARW